jgi:hypothetical protein
MTRISVCHCEELKATKQSPSVEGQDGLRLPRRLSAARNDGERE